MASSVSQTQGVYLKQQLRSVTRRYLDHFLPASPSLGAIANHPVLLSACQGHATPQGAALRVTILEVLWWVPRCLHSPGCDVSQSGSNPSSPLVCCSESFLQFKGLAPPPRLQSVLSFLLELLRRSGDSDPAVLTVPVPALLRCLMLLTEPQGESTELWHHVLSSPLQSYPHSSISSVNTGCRRIFNVSSLHQSLVQSHTQQ